MKHKPNLHDVPLFARLSPNELKLITNISKTKRYKKNEIVYLEGETYSGFYVVLSGLVKVYRLGDGGEEITLNKPGSFRSFAESSLFSGSRFYTSCAQALEDSTLLYFPTPEFTSLIGKNPALAIRISQALAVRLMELDRRLDILASGVEGRIARYLLNEVQLNNSINLPEPVFNLVIHKKDLAAHLGIASATLSRTLKKLKQEKIIREVSKRIFVTNLKRLRELTKE